MKSGNAGTAADWAHRLDSRKALSGDFAFEKSSRGIFMVKKIWLPGTALIILIQAAILFGSECSTCHTARGVRESTPDTAPIEIQENGKIRSITLSDAFNFHGHSCPGVTTTFRALQYGIRILYGEEIPERGDLLVFTRTPTSGSLDFLDLVMLGEKRSIKTVPPKGMKPGRENFIYTLYRKSTCTAVDIQLKPENFPKDFFEYKKKQSNGALPTEEWNTLHDYMKNIILNFPKRSLESLFGKPKPYQAVLWGDPAPIPAHHQK